MVIIYIMIFYFGISYVNPGGMYMEIRTLKYFLAVAREENMTRAAELLNVTQPTLSKQLKSLEDELGKKLFTRHSFSIELTEEGRLLRDQAEDLVSMADKISREFMSMDDITGGELYLGLAESHLISYIAGAIKQLKETYPDLHYQIVSGDTEQVIDKLNKGILDFAVLAEAPDDSRYESMVFPEADIWGLIMPADDSLSKEKSVRVNDLIGLPLFCSEQAWANDIPGWAGDDFDKLRLEGSFKLSYNASVFAKEKLGYLLTFDKLIDTSESSGLCFRPLSPRLESKLYLIWKKNQAFSPMAERFLMQMQSTLLR